MSYARVVLYLCIASTLTLACLWWISLRELNSVGYISRSPEFAIQIELYSASVWTTWNPPVGDSPDPGFYHLHLPASSPHIAKAEPMGRFGWNWRGQALTGFELPLWVYYLAFVSVVVIALKLTQGRLAKKRKESIKSEQDDTSQRPC